MYPMMGNIYYADLPFEKNLQSGRRPVIVVQNDDGNKNASFVHMIPLTSKVEKGRHIPTHVILTPTKENGLGGQSVALVENLRPVPKSCLKRHVGHLCSEEISELGKALRIQFPFM